MPALSLSLDEVRHLAARSPLVPVFREILSDALTPVTAYRLLRVRGDTRPLARAGGAPLVGRGSQLRMLADAFANLVRERSCGLFTVLGMAGVGVAGHRGRPSSLSDGEVAGWTSDGCVCGPRFFIEGTGPSEAGKVFQRMDEFVLRL